MGISSTLAKGYISAVQTITFLSRLERTDKGERDNIECLPKYDPSPYKHKPLIYPCTQNCAV